MVSKAEDVSVTSLFSDFPTNMWYVMHFSIVYGLSLMQYSWNRKLTLF